MARAITPDIAPLSRLSTKLATLCAGLVVAGALLGMGSTTAHAAADGTIRQDATHKWITLSDGQGKLALRLNYDGQCVLDQVTVRGRQVSSPTGTASGIKIGGKWYTTRSDITTPTVSLSKNTLTVKDIAFGQKGEEVRENWQFQVQPDRILWRINRTYPKAMTLEDAAFPEWNFSSMATWKGGILGNGGVVWNKYLENPNMTYGAHTGMVTFWNPDSNDCLRITPTLSQGLKDGVRFSHQPKRGSNPGGDEMSFNYVASSQELQTKYNLNRFLGDRQDLWAPFPVNAGEQSVELSLQALDYDQAYYRGRFPGLDSHNLRELLNTAGRYGVIDSQQVGANGWRSGYICLHEQWFAQIGMALNDPNYNISLSDSLNQWRDHAVGPDGRVKSRWKYDAGDAMGGTYDPKSGYYEAQWGYLMDSQTDYVMEVAEQFDITGDKAWLAGQKISCERALEYLMRREVGNTGLVQVMTDSLTQQRGSDWFDIIWASYQNALINAELYNALNLWANAEETLGDTAKATTYRNFAARLKASFNRPTTEGGFWEPNNQWYVYWREKDDSIHGNNLFTAVNFAAIGYGLCDDPTRKKVILDRIEAEMQKEKLFHWPTNFFPFTQPEATHNQPFPTYENGDIFLSWGELATRAYAGYDPDIALKYIKQVLARYKEDGLSYQRYARRSQQGLGDDILAGNCMTIVGLYRNIYGLQPKPNRLYLEPHMLPELNGTQIFYQLRGQQYTIDLSTTKYTVSSDGYSLSGTSPFGTDVSASGLRYFPAQGKQWEMEATRSTKEPLTIQIGSWPTPANPQAPRQWTEALADRGTIKHSVVNLSPNAVYALKIDGKAKSSVRTDAAGRTTFSTKLGKVAPQRFELSLKTK